MESAFSVTLFNLSYLSAIRLTTVTAAVVLLYTAPAFSLVLARFILGESLNLKKIFSLFLTFFGVVLLWLYILGIALFSTMLPYLFFVSGLKHLEAGRATLVAAVEPVVAILLAALFLNETVSLLQGIGVVSVVAAVRWQTG